ncbi:HAD-IIB family hydrolase [Mycoplasmopsis cynos]|uniref:HAD family hydrolase n=2 Tax=Mycoplasmopsis cynos TaxID=171284 RepID=A0ABD8AIX9_9BACT|nr:HAD family hydrolase [Mycoplasmopsis cynos]UWV86222.1 Cof-type HAD-IIB family hydrolase [Mycoplasmopsis cynos]WAM08610.1 Cof-type HAD-IIB family hydrolase [Mycoplasmopsis cynos]WQQ13103.1 HAD family hydrolase [Mycoplasmopsis cynos]WQQ14207.1 HAD family hydrolase [Mycoplasmopsis cynos]WQQ14599.1 HAD family hydrolase [Mycoplasmopsis cynos]
MKKPKIIFIDLDGTTLDGPGEKFWEKEPTEYTKSVINRLQSQIPVVVSTGRGVNDKTLNIVRKLGSETYIAWNGAQTVENGVVVKKHIIDKDISQELFNEIKKNKCFVVYNSNVKYYAFVKNWFYKLLMGFGKKSAKKYNEYKNDFDVYKALIWSLSKTKIKKLAEKWGKMFEGKLEVSLSGSNNVLEITAANVSKGSAEVDFCLSKGIDPSEAIHFGDSMNDSSAKGKIGKLIAMANSVEELKQMADDITEHECNNSGLARYLEKNFLK